MAAVSTAVNVSSVTCDFNVSGVPAVAGFPSFVGIPAVAIAYLLLLSYYC
jgi:hypothetical protein